ncbi:MAG: PPOX class F420-dependent oxidoreductase [Chloroflexi bacterium]|nr:PPOX class F420-dependent oxidoreductase [Chloroflexota bacterium]
MTPGEADTFLRETRIAKLATLNTDGSPNIVPVWFEWDGKAARVFTSRGSPKVRRIRRDPRVALSVEEGVGAQERWVTIEGMAAISEDGGIELARQLIERYYDAGRIAETWPSWERMAAEWVVITVTPARIRSG